MLVEARGPVGSLAAVALPPDQAPLAVQLFVFVDDHVSVASAPLATDNGLALKLSAGVGAGAWSALTIAGSTLASPPHAASASSASTTAAREA